MTKTVVQKTTLNDEAYSLKEFLEEIETLDDFDLSTAYVEDETGRQFGSVRLIEETLTDGSKVFNVVLCESA